MSNSFVEKKTNEPVLTQAQFNALENKVSGTIYHIKGEMFYKHEIISNVVNKLCFITPRSTAYTSVSDIVDDFRAGLLLGCAYLSGNYDEYSSLISISGTTIYYYSIQTSSISSETLAIDSDTVTTL